METEHTQTKRKKERTERKRREKEEMYTLDLSPDNSSILQKGKLRAGEEK